MSISSLETLNLIENGEMVKAGLYVSASVVLCIAAGSAAHTCHAISEYSYQNSHYRPHLHQGR
jgi:fluoride ion exporter CrcB/FEX